MKTSPCPPFSTSPVPFPGEATLTGAGGSFQTFLCLVISVLQQLMSRTGQQHTCQFIGKPNGARGCEIPCPKSSSCKNKGPGSGGLEGQRGLQSQEGGQWGEGSGGTSRMSGTHSHFYSDLGFGVKAQPHLFQKPENWRAMYSDPTTPEQTRGIPIPPIQKIICEASGKLLDPKKNVLNG